MARFGNRKSKQSGQDVTPALADLLLVGNDALEQRTARRIRDCRNSDVLTVPKRRPARESPTGIAYEDGC